jgi:HSP20 family protein
VAWRQFLVNDGLRSVTAHPLWLQRHDFLSGHSPTHIRPSPALFLHEQLSRMVGRGSITTTSPCDESTFAGIPLMPYKIGHADKKILVAQFAVCHSAASKTRLDEWYRRHIMGKEEKKEGKGPKTGKELEVSRPTGFPSPFEEMEHWFEGAFPRGWMRPFRRGWPGWSEFPMPFEGRMPKVDVIDRDEEVVVRAEVPGVEKDDLDVSLSENALTIKGETKHEEKEEKGDYHRSEISRGAFTRTVMLPAVVDTDKAKAEFKDGVLELTMPKVEKTKRRTIKID